MCAYLRTTGAPPLCQRSFKKFCSFMQAIKVKKDTREAAKRLEEKQEAAAIAASAAALQTNTNISTNISNASPAVHDREGTPILPDDPASPFGLQRVAGSQTAMPIAYQDSATVDALASNGTAASPLPHAAKITSTPAKVANVNFLEAQSYLEDGDSDDHDHGHDAMEGSDAEVMHNLDPFISALQETVGTESRCCCLTACLAIV